jgi:hypothetical protein
MRGPLTAMQYRASVDDYVPEGTSALCEAPPEAILRAADVSADELARVQHFRRLTGRGRVFCAEELMHDVLFGGAREGHLEDGADEGADACGTVYFDPGLRARVRKVKERKRATLPTGGFTGTYGFGSIDGAKRTFLSIGTSPITWSACMCVRKILETLWGLSHTGLSGGWKANCLVVPS